MNKHIDGKTLRNCDEIYEGNNKLLRRYWGTPPLVRVVMEGFLKEVTW